MISPKIPDKCYPNPLHRLDLPPYPSEEKMMDKLTQAVEETCGFAVE